MRTFLNEIENLVVGAALTLVDRKGRKVVIEHGYDYVYVVSLGEHKKDFLLSEVASFLDRYQAARGILSVAEEVVKA